MSKNKKDYLKNIIIKDADFWCEFKMAHIKLQNDDTETCNLKTHGDFVKYLFEAWKKSQ